MNTSTVLTDTHRPATPANDDHARRGFENPIAVHAGQSVSAIGRAIVGAFEGFKRWRTRQASIHELAVLDDHLLRDIGIHRSEIRSVVDGLLKGDAERTVVARSAAARTTIDGVPAARQRRRRARRVTPIGSASEAPARNETTMETDVDHWHISNPDLEPYLSRARQARAEAIAALFGAIAKSASAGVGAISGRVRRWRDRRRTIALLAALDDRPLDHIGIRRDRIAAGFLQDLAANPPSKPPRRAVPPPSRRTRPANDNGYVDAA